MKAYKYRDIEYFERDFETLLRNQIYAPPFIDLNATFEGMCNQEITHLAKFLEEMFNIDSTEVVESLHLLQ